ESRGFLGLFEELGLFGRMSGVEGCTNEFRRVASYTENPIDFPQARGGTAAFAMQVRGGIAEFEHLTGCENPAAMSWCGGEKFRHRIQRGRARIVGVVDHRKAIFKTGHFAAL